MGRFKVNHDLAILEEEESASLLSLYDKSNPDKNMFNLVDDEINKDQVVDAGFRKATIEGYNYRRVCREPDHDIYYSGWMDCYDWILNNKK